MAAGPKDPLDEAHNAQGSSSAPAPDEARWRVDPQCVEVRGLRLGLRRAFRMRLPSQKLFEFHRTFEDLGLFVLSSEISFKPLEGGRLLQDKSQGGGLHLLVASIDPEEARACMRDELENAARGEGDDLREIAAAVAAHRRLGAAYGYPACCVQAFSDAWVEGMWRRARVVSDNALAILRSVRRSDGFHPWLRAFGGGSGQETDSPLRHLPCRFDCAPSIELAGALLDDLRSSNPDQRRRYLDSPVFALSLDAGGRIRPASSLSPASTSPVEVGDSLRSRFPLRLPFVSLSSPLEE